MDFRSLFSLGALVTAIFSATAQAGTLVEDFTNLDHADLTQSTGVWNVVDHAAQAAIVADEDATRVIPFGNGSDGILNSSSGYIFDTDTHPTGFNFISVSITGGPITVRGSNPLVIRSLGEVTITPDLSVSGGEGEPGQASLTENLAGPAGGNPIAARSSGGAGGKSFETLDATLLNGSDGLQSDGLAFNSAGPGDLDLNPGVDGNSMGPGPGPDFDTTGFIAGTGGGGGGGQYHEALGTKYFTTGGGGGAGAGTLRISAIGLITMGNIYAQGGTGGAAAKSDGICSGHGAGGNGGGVWLQSWKGVTTANNPDIEPGEGGTNLACPIVLGNPGFIGFRRADGPALPGTWVLNGVTTYFDVSNAAASQTYIVQSKPYDLGTMNAAFTTNPSITSQTNGGTIALEYAGSENGAVFSNYTSELTTLSNQNIRYLKFRLTLTTAGIPGDSPAVSKITVPYDDLGWANTDLSISPGCGMITDKQKPSGPPSPGPLIMAFWFAAFFLFWGFLKKRIDV
ncbi:MAG: hypothetical protein A2Z97_15170 [Bdellovibrionales bacterium GWB1_52_6]|nr:MAG: hypothetical protein A2Z97_15170 [Bdellovibrionales bacterium GWB1_52_6]OFZ03891.1 MAG: hypothetical protein A2X97_15950 [Bdellovibrionales bacterium GWA1_52_35]HCM39674.1 hypothetical protein [Bdellovibrionales bacterium]